MAEKISEDPPPYTSFDESTSDIPETNSYSYHHEGYYPQQAGYPGQANPHPTYPHNVPQQGSYPLQPGFSNQDTSNNVIVRQQPVTTGALVVTNRVDRHMGLAVFGCLCCFIPGIIAIYFSHEALSAMMDLDINRARRLAERSKYFSIMAITGGLCILVITVILIVAS